MNIIRKHTKLYKKANGTKDTLPSWIAAIVSLSMLPNSRIFVANQRSKLQRNLTRC